ncbi:MAG: DNA topoisomerase 3 [Myxococcota bacterium]
MRVVVAEKPSVARDLARVLGVTRRADGYLEGDGLRITWCHGHMAELEEPAHYDPAWKRWALDALPMVPGRFALRVRPGAVDQFAVLKKLLRDPETTDVVNACDAGREGELIFRYTTELAGCTRPVLRLWTSSLTDEAIRKAWGALRPGAAFDRLGEAARCRSEADWLVGMNATRALTCRARDAGPGDLLSVGRVQTPTLAMIVARDRAIAAFVPETYWGVRATFDAAAGSFVARFFRPDLAKDERGDRAGAGAASADDAEPETPNAERLDARAVAEAIAARTTGRPATIETAERKRTRERPPLLYDLTTLQRRANQRYGLSAQRTLEVAQALYERHKLITYPRTDSKYLSPDQVATIPDLLRGLLPVPPYAATVTALLAGPIAPGPRVVNAAEVGDHPAITPTGRTPSPGLDPDEKRVFDLVARRFLAALSEDALFDATRLVVAVDPGPDPLPTGFSAPLRYRTSGRVCAQLGWRAIDPPGKGVELELPAVQPGDPATARDGEAHEGKTRPPRHYTDGTLLLAMETAGRALDDEALARAMRGMGLGTPATRAAILQTLLDRKYVERQGKELHATDRGSALIDAVPIDELKNAELTAVWEGRLSEMADGRGIPAERFMVDVVDHVRRMVDALASAAPAVIAADSQVPSLGACPKCGGGVRPRGPVFACDGGRACGFVVFTTIAKRKIGPRAVKQLLTVGRTPVMKGFQSKAGRAFDAGLQWDAEAGRVTLWFPDRDEATEREPEPEVAGTKSAGTKSAGTKSAGTKSAGTKSAGTKSGGARARRTAEPVHGLPPGLAAPAPRAAPRAHPGAVEGDPCPACGVGSIIRGRTALGCSRWRDGCTFRAPGAGGAGGIPSASPVGPGEGQS